MYKATIFHMGDKIMKTGDSPEECLHRLQDHLQTFYNQEHRLRYRAADMSVFTDRASNAPGAHPADSLIGSIIKVIPKSH